jgi:hypothetical protein
MSATPQRPVVYDAGKNERSMNGSAGQPVNDNFPNITTTVGPELILTTTEVSGDVNVNGVTTTTKKVFVKEQLRRDIFNSLCRVKAAQKLITEARDQTAMALGALQESGAALRATEDTFKQALAAVGMFNTVTTPVQVPVQVTSPVQVPVQVDLTAVDENVGYAADYFGAPPSDFHPHDMPPVSPNGSENEEHACNGYKCTAQIPFEAQLCNGTSCHTENANGELQHDPETQTETQTETPTETPTETKHVDWEDGDILTDDLLNRFVPKTGPGTKNEAIDLTDGDDTDDTDDTDDDDTQKKAEAAGSSVMTQRDGESYSGFPVPQRNHVENTEPVVRSENTVVKLVKLLDADGTDSGRKITLKQLRESIKNPKNGVEVSFDDDDDEKPKATGSESKRKHDSVEDESVKVESKRMRVDK